MTWPRAPLVLPRFMTRTLESNNISATFIPLICDNLHQNHKPQICNLKITFPANKISIGVRYKISQALYFAQDGILDSNASDVPIPVACICSAPVRACLLGQTGWGKLHVLPGQFRKWCESLPACFSLWTVAVVSKSLCYHKPENRNCSCT